MAFNFKIMKTTEDKLRDLLNWIKSDLAQEENHKLARTQTPYRIEKIRFLRKLQSILNEN